MEGIYGVIPESMEFLQSLRSAWQSHDFNNHIVSFNPDIRCRSRSTNQGKAVGIVRVGS